MTYKLLLLTAAAASAIASTAWAQDPPPGEDEATGVDELVITGSRTPRVRLDTIAPVDVITSAELIRGPTTETAQALANAAPSLDFPRPSITDGTDSVRPATLRGLSPDQTLVLVNGVRRHASALVNVNGSIGRGSAAVDLNAIPSSALSTVEILRDGASAQYGSDAIAGVINLRLREAREGGNVTVTGGFYDTLVRPARIPQGYEKSDGGTVDVSGWAGLPLGAEGFVTVSGEWRHRDPTSRSDLDPRQNPPKIRSRYGDAETDDILLYVNAGAPLNTNWDAYGWLGYNGREVESAATARVPSNPNNDINVYPDGFLPIIAPDIDDYSGAVGLKGEALGLTVDANYSYGSNRIAYRVEDSINGSLVPNSPTSFDAGGLKYSQHVAGLDLVKPLSFGGFEEAILAFGAEYRHESYEIFAGEEASHVFVPGRPGAGAGSQGFIGFRPSNEVDISRHSMGVYGDLDMRITDNFNIGVAVRYEDFSDFGDTTTGKVAARYDLTDSFAVRGAVSTGFRAPSLQQQGFTATAINFIVIGGVSTPTEVVTLQPNDPLALSLGAKPLKAEESTNLSLGVVYHQGPFELTVDGYRIDVDERIVLSEILQGAPTGSATTVAIFNLLNPNGGTLGGARFFINGVDSETQGIDVIGRYRLATDRYGRFNFTVAANFNKTEVTRVPAIPTSVPIPNPPSLFNRINVLTLEKGTPESKISAAVDWTGDQWGAALKVTRYGGVLHPFNVDPAFDVRTNDHLIIDFEGRKRLGEQVNVAIGVNNLLDEYPDPTEPFINTTGALAFSNYSPFGFNGRFYYVRASLDF